MSVIEVAFITGPAVIVAGAVYIADRLSHSAGRHAITPQRNCAAPRDPFADPADRTDPDGDRYVERLHDDTADAPWPYDRRPLAELVRGLGGTAFLPELPLDPPPDPTGVLPPATCYLGESSDDYVERLFPTSADVDELFSEHAEAQP